VRLALEQAKPGYTIRLPAWPGGGLCAGPTRAGNC
jgi:hypothetical protein